MFVFIDVLNILKLEWGKEKWYMLEDWGEIYFF